MQDFSNKPGAGKRGLSPARRQRDGGYLLLAIMLMMALIIIAATVTAPRYVQQIKRDREEEMIHRGAQYARAIKKFYKKNGRYPASLDDLDKGQVKYLRQRYKDPLTKDGKWKLLNYADIQSVLNTGAPGTPAAAMGTLGGATPGLTSGASGSSFGGSSFGGSSFGSNNFGSSTTQQQQQQTGPITTGFSSNSDQGGNAEGVPSNNVGSTSSTAGSNTGFSLDIGNGQSNNSNSGTGQAGGATGNQPGGTTGSSSGNGQSFGGGAIVGVASLSKDPTIRIYNKKKTYDQWQFIYNPMMDQTNTLIKGPYQPPAMTGQQIGTPASQMNGQQQTQSPFGQQQSPFGQGTSGQNSFGQSSGFGQQNTPQSAPTQPQQ